MKTLVIIPSRMSATRLPGKPLLKINGLSIISHVSKKAEEANIGDVIVATEDQEIIDDVITREVEWADEPTDDIQNAWVDIKDLVNKFYNEET